jgi:tetrahydromethanopterin S-methyltransferase subunit D
MEGKMKKYSLLVVAMVFIISTVTGYTQPRSAPATPTTETKEFLISGALSGGAAYSVTIAIGELLNKYVTVPYKLKVVVQPITAMVESPKRRWGSVFLRIWVKCQCGCFSGVIRMLIISIRLTPKYSRYRI